MTDDDPIVTLLVLFQLADDMWRLFGAVSTLMAAMAAFPPTLRYPLPAVVNKIAELNVTCDAATLNVTVMMQNPFKGLLFAKDFSQECLSSGKSTIDQDYSCEDNMQPFKTAYSPIQTSVASYSFLQPSTIVP